MLRAKPCIVIHRDSRTPIAPSFARSRAHAAPAHSPGASRSDQAPIIPSTTPASTWCSRAIRIIASASARDVPAHVAAVRPEVEDRVRHELTGAVVGDVAAAPGLDEVDAARRPARPGRASTFSGFAPRPSVITGSCSRQQDRVARSRPARAPRRAARCSSCDRGVRGAGRSRRRALIAGRLDGHLWPCAGWRCEPRWLSSRAYPRLAVGLDVRRETRRRSRGRTASPSTRSISVTADLVGERAAVRAVAGHRVVGVGHGDDARDDRDLVAPHPERVAAAVPALVVQVHAGDERVQELDRVEDVAPVAGVPLEHLVLVVRELARLVQVEHAADLADVVHERALPDDLDLVRARGRAACASITA